MSKLAWARLGQKLHEHLLNVSHLASDFAAVFGAKDWGLLAGLWHDLGKFSEPFQRKLKEQSNQRVDHSTAGARHAIDCLGSLGKILAYSIAGHHAGLPDGMNNDSSCLEKRLNPNIIKIPDYSAHTRCCSLPSKPAHPISLPFKQRNSLAGFQLSFFIRMLFSCLVDADRLDSEAVGDPDRA